MNIFNKIIVLILLLTCYRQVKAGDNPLSNYRFEVKNMRTVFPDAVELNIIYNFYEDKSGFMWFATENGLIRYDGYKLKYYLPDAKNKNSIGHCHVKFVTGDAEGNLWVGLYRKGLDYFNQKTNSFTHYPLDKAGKIEIAAKTVYVDKNNQVWVVTMDNRLARLNKSDSTFSFYDVVTPENISFIKSAAKPDRFNRGLGFVVDGDENDLWITTAYGLFDFNKATGKSICYSSPGPRLDMPVYGVNSVVKLGDNLWCGGGAAGLRSLNIKTKEWNVYYFSSFAKILYADNILNRIAIKDDHELWLATNDKGLGVFNINTKQFSFFSDQSSLDLDLCEPLCLNVFQDSGKNIWAFYDTKVLRITPSTRFIFKIDLPAIRKDNNEFYYSTDVLEESSGNYLLIGSMFTDGLYLMNLHNLKFERFDFQTTLKGDNSLKVCKLIEINNNKVWVLTRDVLMLFDVKTKLWIKVKQPPLLNSALGSNVYTDATMDADSNLWIVPSIAGYEGLICYNTKKQEARFIDHTTVKGDNYFGKIKRLVCDKHNRIWFRNSLARSSGYYDIKTNTEVDLDANGNPASKSVATIFMSAGTNNRILLATDDGLLIYNANATKPFIEKKLTAADGLKSDMIEFQSQDRDGNIWYICNDAVYRYSVGNHKNELFDAKDMLVNDRGPLKCGKDSLVFVLARQGFNIINLNRLISDSIHANIRLTSFQIDGNEVNFKDQLELKNLITVPSGYSYLSFEFANLDFAHVETMIYSYKLEGIDDNWINAGQRRNASYTNLPGGNYKLLVRCALSNNEWNKSILAVPIFIETVYYKTFWFRLIVVITLSVLLFAIYRYRTTQQKAIDDLYMRAQFLEKEKSIVQYENLKQQLNPHFLFNSLTSLSSLISIDAKTARQFVDQMSKIYRYILKSSENETVPLINEINFASTYVKLQQTRFEKGFVVKITVDAEFNDRKIVPVTVQNMIENAIKHNIIDIESPLVIDIYIEDEYLVVKNNLQKKGIVETSNKQGLDKMKSLYKYLSDRPIIVNETETHYEIKIPLI